MKIILIYLIIGVIWTFISEKIYDYNKKEEKSYIEIHPNEENLPIINWTWELRIAFILTWPIGLYQFIKNLIH